MNFKKQTKEQSQAHLKEIGIIRYQKTAISNDEKPSHTTSIDKN